MKAHSVGVSLVVFSGLMLAPVSRAQLTARPGEWPAFRGPDRNNVSAETGLLKTWPSGGPGLAWKATGLGQGFSTPSLADGKIFVVGTAGTPDECLIALDAKDGRILWKTPFGKMKGGHPGPRSTPTFDDGWLYVISSDGKLLCASAADGAAKWTRDLVADFGGKFGSWAYAESPLVDGEKVACTPGGPAATMVALNKKTGETLWKSAIPKDGGYTTAGYSSIMAADIGGVRQYVQFLSGGVVGVSAADGTFLWNYDQPANRTANCSTPIVRGDLVLAASAYNTGGGLVQIVKKDGGFAAEEKYFLEDLQNHHGGLVLVGDYVYATGGSELFCVEFKTGRIAWRNRSVGKGSVAAAGGSLVVRSENGPVALVEANPEKYEERGRFDQPDRSKDKAWPYPVIAGGCLYIRDQDVLLCYNVKE